MRRSTRQEKIAKIKRQSQEVTQHSSKGLEEVRSILKGSNPRVTPISNQASVLKALRNLDNALQGKGTFKRRFNRSKARRAMSDAVKKLQKRVFNSKLSTVTPEHIENIVRMGREYTTYCNQNKTDDRLEILRKVQTALKVLELSVGDYPSTQIAVSNRSNPVKQDQRQRPKRLQSHAQRSTSLRNVSDPDKLVAAIAGKDLHALKQVVATHNLRGRFAIQNAADGVIPNASEKGSSSDTSAARPIFAQPPPPKEHRRNPNKKSGERSDPRPRGA